MFSLTYPGYLSGDGCRLLSMVVVAKSSRTDLCDDVVDVTSFSALDVVETKKW